MDTSKQYFEMCEQAKEIQEYRPFGKAWEEGDCFVTKGKLSKYRIVSRHKNDVWLPRQDQLQEMDNWSDLALTFSQGCHSFIKGRPDLYDAVYFLETDDNQKFVARSMEQLWLAFVMSEKYNKTWSGKRWLNCL